MNFSLYIAKRYLFSKKSHNAINFISGASVCGIAIATIAIVCTLSVFNGFHDLVDGMFSTFDPQLKISPVKGKVFDTQSEQIKSIRSMPEIAVFTEVLEDNVLLKYKGRQVPATIKGVTDNFKQLARIDSILIDGDEFKLNDGVNNFGTFGVGLAMNLGINAGFVYPIEIYAPKRNVQVNLSNPAESFTQNYVYIGGVFSINQQVYDDHVLIAPISLARSLFDYETEVSTIEIKLHDGVNADKVQSEIQKRLGDGFNVQNQYEQQEAAFRMMNIEKWVTFLILCFIVVIAVFNVIGSLSMLIIEKREDVLTLRNLGANNKQISRIFLFEGWMISATGAFSGLILGLLLCLGQQKFGWLKLGDASGSFVVNSYPVTIALEDLIFTLFTVLIIGLLAAVYPVRYLSKKWLNQ